MSTLAEMARDRSSKERGSVECKPLLEAAHKELFRRNAFRITGLSVDASSREIAKHADKLKIMQELGQAATAQAAFFPLSPPPSSDDLREAIQRLKDPEKRLVDEFFWFWPEEFGKSAFDPAIQALLAGDGDTAFQIWVSKESSPADGVVAMHNVALVWHLTALEWETYTAQIELDKERREKIESYWRNAFKRWEVLAMDDALWEKLTARARQIDDARLTTGFVRRMRATLPDALDKINAELALSYAESGKLDLARMHIQFMRETHQGIDNVENTAEAILTPARSRLKEQIRRAKDRANKNPRDAATAARELLEQARHTLALFDLFFGKQSDLRNDLFDEVAAVCNELPVTYHKATGDDKTCLELLRAVLPFATSIDLRQQIEKNISTLSGNLAFKNLEPFYALLRAIQDSQDQPRSRLEKFNHEVAGHIQGAAAGLPLEDRNQLLDSIAIVLRGVSLAAWNNHQDLKTAISANELAIEYATSPELKRRLTEDRTTLDQMRTQIWAAAEARRRKSNATAAGWSIVVVIIVLLGIIGSCNSSNTSPSVQLYSPSTISGGQNSDENTYRVPRSLSSSLDTERAAIESERAMLEALGMQIERLGSEIERDRFSLDRSSRYEVQQFDEKVDRYNTLLQRAKFANAALNQKVDSYNVKVRQYGR